MGEIGGVVRSDPIDASDNATAGAGNSEADQVSDGMEGRVDTDAGRLRKPVRGRRWGRQFCDGGAVRHRIGPELRAFAATIYSVRAARCSINVNKGEKPYWHGGRFRRSIPRSRPLILFIECRTAHNRLFGVATNRRSCSNCTPSPTTSGDLLGPPGTTSNGECPAESDGKHLSSRLPGARS
jgi:hypothetical protein